MTYHCYVIAIQQNLVQLCDSPALRCNLTGAALGKVGKNTEQGTTFTVLVTEPALRRHLLGLRNQLATLQRDLDKLTTRVMKATGQLTRSLGFSAQYRKTQADPQNCGHFLNNVDAQNRFQTATAYDPGINVHPSAWQLVTSLTLKAGKSKQTNCWKVQHATPAKLISSLITSTKHASATR